MAHFATAGMGLCSRQIALPLCAVPPSPTPGLRVRFSHQVLGSLVCRYHDCFMDDVYINIVMEYCNAGDLAGLIKQKGGRYMPEAEVMSLFVQVCGCKAVRWSACTQHHPLCAMQRW